MELLYWFAYSFHIVAFMLGLECLRRGDKVFSNSTPVIRFCFARLCDWRNPFCFSFDDDEVRYWILNIGTSTNFVFLLILPIYVSYNIGYMPFWEELAFNFIHLGTGIMTTLVHYLSYKTIITGGLNGDVGKNT